MSDAPIFDSGGGTSVLATLAEDLDEPVHSELDMSMKSPLAYLYNPGSVPSDQESVFLYWHTGPIQLFYNATSSGRRKW